MHMLYIYMCCIRVFFTSILSRFPGPCVCSTEQCGECVQPRPHHIQRPGGAPRLHPRTPTSDVTGHDCSGEEGRGGRPVCRSTTSLLDLKDDCDSESAPGCLIFWLKLETRVTRSKFPNLSWSYTIRFSSLFFYRPLQGRHQKRLPDADDSRPGRQVCVWGRLWMSIPRYVSGILPCKSLVGCRCLFFFFFVTTENLCQA